MNSSVPNEFGSVPIHANSGLLWLSTKDSWAGMGAKLSYLLGLFSLGPTPSSQ